MLVLTEDFIYSDGEIEQRIWKIKKLDDSSYQGYSKDVDGFAIGESNGNALYWAYSMDLKMGDDKMHVSFDDWMYLQPDNVLINRAIIKKWGVKLAEVSIFFKKVER